MIKKPLLLLIALTLCACISSPRKEYFALNAEAPEFTQTENTVINDLIGIGPVIIPEYLQLNRISYWKTPQQLIMLDNAYWAEPLEQGITRVVALRLQNQNRQWRVIQHPWRSNQRPNYSLRMDIQRLDALTNNAVLEANLDIIDTRSNQIIASRHLKIRVDAKPANAKPNATAIASAYSELLQQAADMASPLIPQRKN